MTQIQITTPGVKKALSRYNPLLAIAEYVWNGFDAKASCVELVFEANEIGYITKFAIKDNGYGIPFDKLGTKFVPLFESDKVIDPNAKTINSAIHGKNGVGRLTFFHFANNATWETVYQSDHKRYKYRIQIDVEKLNTYSAEESSETQEQTGTIVSFEGIKAITSHNFETDIKDFLMREFGWFLELNSSKQFALKINGSALDYSSMIRGTREKFTLTHSPTQTPFEIKYVQWNEKLNEEYSRYYFIDSSDNELFKETTTLNNKGDHFYHSVYIKSKLFDNFNMTVDETSDQTAFGHSRRDDEYKYLKTEVDKFLRRKRKPFLKAYTDKLIAELESDNAFPKYNLSNAWDSTRKNELENIVKGLYQIEPKIFSGLNIEQKKTLLALLDLVMDSDEKDKLFTILQEVVDLDATDRTELAELLKTSRLSRIISTIKLIQDRYKTVAELKELLFNKDLKANEKDHLQKMIEKHYWLFGEQYHLVTAAEPKFEEALKKWVHLLRGGDEKVTVNHPDKLGEMDIFAVRQDLLNNTVKNVVVELKSPKTTLGKEQYDQVMKYLDVILKQPECNAHNMSWEFYLVGNAFDSSGYLDLLFQNAKNHGEPFLAFKTDRYKIYVKKWSEILSDFELRHKFLNDKLEVERDKLLGKAQTADDIIRKQNDNHAAQ
ncbi:MAG: ATP-binding protein [Dehalococcoides mccartyi]|uniref:ATP-binding protein n=1 Tax=Dehalococcoides mccartyi TaxID=61435 RepID=UPI0030FABD4B